MHGLVLAWHYHPLVPAGAIMLHQILNTNQFNGKGRNAFRQFVDQIVKPSGGDLYLSVGRENRVAWKNTTIPGLVYGLAQGGKSAQRQNPRCSEAASTNRNADAGSAKPVEQGEN